MLRRDTQLSDVRKSLQEVEYSREGPGFNLTVNYRNDPAEHRGCALPRGKAHITDTGLLDPGLGNGPTEFSDIDGIVVHSEPRQGPTSTDYSIKFETLRDLVARIPGARSGEQWLAFDLRDSPGSANAPA